MLGSALVHPKAAATDSPSRLGTWIKQARINLKATKWETILPVLLFVSPRYWFYVKLPLPAQPPRPNGGDGRNSIPSHGLEVKVSKRYPHGSHSASSKTLFYSFLRLSSSVLYCEFPLAICSSFFKVPMKESCSISVAERPKLGYHFEFWGSWAELLWDMKVQCIEAGGGSGNGTNDDPEKWWVGEVRRAEGEEH